MNLLLAVQGGLPRLFINPLFITSNFFSNITSENVTTATQFIAIIYYSIIVVLLLLKMF